MYYIKVTTNELFHYGIKGQKHGVQNGPPYPLDYEDHSAEEKRLNNPDTITPDEDIDEERKKEKTKKILIGTAIGVGAAAAIGAAWLVGKKYGTDYEKNMQKLKNSERSKKAAATRKVNAENKKKVTTVVSRKFGPNDKPLSSQINVLIDDTTFINNGKLELKIIFEKLKKHVKGGQKTK